MPKRPAWITNLHTYTQETDIPDEQAADVNNELHGNSDRAVVVLLGSHIEDELQTAIMRKMIPMKHGDDISLLSG